MIVITHGGVCMREWLIVGGVILVLVLVVISIYNGLVRARNLVKEAFSAMDVSMKKRYDLIPNLVETVKGYASHEKETLDAVITARNKAVSAGTPEGQFEAEGELNQVMNRLFALSENYPDLKANTNFLDLQEQVRLIETEIAQSRRYYNGTARDYNNRTETFPSLIVANMFGFKQYPMFEITNEAERENVQIKF